MHEVVFSGTWQEKIPFAKLENRRSAKNFILICRIVIQRMVKEVPEFGKRWQRC